MEAKDTVYGIKSEKHTTYKPTNERLKYERPTRLRNFKHKTINCEEMEKHEEWKKKANTHSYLAPMLYTGWFASFVILI